MEGLDDLIAEFDLGAEIRVAQQELAEAWSREPGQALKAMRLKAGLRQSDLATRMETTQSAIARLESGRGNMSLDTLGKLAAALGADIGDVARAAQLDSHARS